MRFRRIPLLLLTVFGVAWGCNSFSEGRTHTVQFTTETASTRTSFTDPDGDSYPVLWTAQDSTVRISLNTQPPQEARVHAQPDGRSAYFEASFETGASTSYTFHALSPASAFRSLSPEGEWDYEVPAVQHPTGQSVDPAAMVLAATSPTTGELPRAVTLPFRHLTAYGLCTLTHLNTDIQAVTLDLGPGQSYTVQTRSARDIWFGTKPLDLSAQEVRISVKTGSGSYARSVTFPEGRKLEAGKVARFSVDMAEAAFVPDSKSISILAIGNSFSIDAMQYLYGYLRQAGYEEIHLGNLYIGGCTLQTHATNLSQNNNAYTYYTNDTGNWTSVSGGNIETALKSRDWDFVSVQQASGSSGMADSYEPYLTTVMDAVKTHCPDAKRMWHMTWAYQGNASHSEFGNYGCVQIRMYNAILEAVRTKVLSRGDFDIVIPCGTAVQNLRTSFIGDNVTRDGYHMSYNIGRVVTALMWLKQISGCPLEGIDCQPAGYNLTERQAAAIKEAVEQAYADPYRVSPSSDPPAEWSSHVPDPSLRQVLAAAGADPDAYVELPYRILTYAYYNSTGGSGLTAKVKGSTASNINQFATTQFFSKEDIPVGSILVLKSGYQYRPEGWTRLSAKTVNRPGNVQTQVIPVTESWWNGWAYRAFNLAEADNPALTDERMDALHSVLSIFVPVR